MCKRKADQMFAYLHAELCCLWQKTWLALQTPICKIWSRMLAVWAHCWCKLKLGMFGSLKAIMLASSPRLSFFLTETEIEIQFAMGQADFESLSCPFLFKSFPHKMTRRGPWEMKQDALRTEQ